MVKAGETFREPGGDVIHYQDGNALADAPTKFAVTMLCEPGQPMLTFVDEEELKQRARRRAPRPTAQSCPADACCITATNRFARPRPVPGPLSAAVSLCRRSAACWSAR